MAWDRHGMDVCVLVKGVTLITGLGHGPIIITSVDAFLMCMHRTRCDKCTEVLGDHTSLNTGTVIDSIIIAVSCMYSPVWYTT